VVLDVIVVVSDIFDIVVIGVLVVVVVPLYYI